MRVIYKCGYDGQECCKYKVKLDENGKVIKQELKCEENGCDRCYFMGKPWANVVFAYDDEE